MYVTASSVNGYLHVESHNEPAGRRVVVLSVKTASLSLFGLCLVSRNLKFFLQQVKGYLYVESHSEPAVR
jgi:hypothetical protein